MKINNIKIENFKAISSLDLHFGSKMNVIIGANGVGKSSILLCISKCLSWYLSRIVNLGTGKGSSISDEEIKNDSLVSDIEIVIDKDYKWSLFKGKSRTGRTYSRKSDLSSVKRYITDTINFEEPNNIPLIAYYEVNRSVQGIPVKLHKSGRNSVFDAYDGALGAGANFRRFFEWLREREDIENQEKIERQDLSYADTQLKAVRDAISQALPEFTNLRIKRSPRAITIEKEGQEFKMEQFSDGEKCYITLIGDIARRLAMASPLSANPLTEGSGIILIDEIDLHFHPKWQADIIDKLKRIFPNCQFIVTTHSPYIISSVKNNEDERIFVINNGNLSNLAFDAYGKEVNELLEYYFNVDTLRNSDVQARIDELDRMLADGKVFTPEYDARLDDLKTVLKDDSILLRYESEKIIRRNSDAKNK